MMRSLRRLLPIVIAASACRSNGEPTAPATATSHAGHDAAATPATIHVDSAVAQTLGIRTAPAREGTSASRRRAPATVVYDPAHTIRVSAQPGGQVRSLLLPRVGEEVGEGAVVARLYSPEIRAGFQELLVARDLGEPWFGAAKQRLLSGGVSRADVDAALSKGALETYSVRAPASGIVTSRSVAEGVWVEPGGILGAIDEGGAVVVDVVTPAEHPPIGTRVRLSDPASAESWTGTVSAVLTSADAAGHAVRVTPDGVAPRVGRPLVAEWAGDAVAGVWVPRGAVVDTGERKVVYVSTEEGAYEARGVIVGDRTADEIQILSGLAAGEAVVSAGTFLLDSETQMTGNAGHAGHGG